MRKRTRRLQCVLMSVVVAWTLAGCPQGGGGGSGGGGY